MKGQQTATMSRRALILTAFAPRLPAQPQSPVSLEGIRKYTATAIVSFLGINLVTRHGAASGFARVDERDGETRIEFGAGSIPERCAGINRMGYIREVVSPHGPSRRTFGFMTVSREESFSEARQALYNRAPLQPFVVLDSSGDASASESRVASLHCPSSLRWPDWPSVEAEILRLWPGAPKRVSRLDGFLPGFLSAVRHAMRQGEHGSILYTHNDKCFTLAWSATPAPSGTVELQGSISGAGKARFKVWFEAGHPDSPPLAFEYQPRAYLKVRFDAVTGEQS
jgi:hypothetical protein